MATWPDVRQLALALPETTELDRRGLAAWAVGTELREVLTDAWLIRASTKLAARHLDAQPPS